MKTVYIADDGRCFDNEIDCYEYEWSLNHPHLKEVLFYDKKGEQINNPYIQINYMYTYKVIVKTEEALKDFKEFVDYTGFYSYGYITDTGTWIFDNIYEKFVKED